MDDSLVVAIDVGYAITGNGVRLERVENSARVRDAHSSSSSHPGLHASSSPAAHESLCRTKLLQL